MRYSAGMTSKSDTLLAAWSNFFVAHASAIQQVEQQIAGKAPLNLYEYDVLLTLSRAPDQRLRYSEITDASVFTKSGITRMMRRLESRGYVERVKCEQDARGAFALLTPKGGRALHASWELYSKAVLEIFTGAFTLPEARELERLMGKMIDQIKGVALVQISGGRKIH